MLYAHHKMPQQTALRFNPTEWRQTRLRTGELLTIGELHREFTANPGKWMILNREVFNRILDAAVNEKDLVIQTPTGEVIGEHHTGLHHANDFQVWLPQYAPKPEAIIEPEPPEPVPIIGPPPIQRGIPTFDTKNVSAKVAVGQLADHITSNNIEWTKIEQVTMQRRQPGVPLLPGLGYPGVDQRQAELRVSFRRRRHHPCSPQPVCRAMDAGATDHRAGECHGRRERRRRIGHHPGPRQQPPGDKGTA